MFLAVVRYHVLFNMCERWCVQNLKQKRAHIIWMLFDVCVRGEPFCPVAFVSVGC